MSDDFPTPKANTSYVPLKTVVESPASSDTQSDADSVWSKRSSKSDFDELYDISESEVDDLPFKLSSSVKKRVNPADQLGTRRLSSLLQASGPASTNSGLLRHCRRQPR